MPRFMYSISVVTLKNKIVTGLKKSRIIPNRFLKITYFSITLLTTENKAA